MRLGSGWRASTGPSGGGTGSLEPVRLELASAARAGDRLRSKTNAS